MTPPEEPYKILDLFAGVGGLSLGFELLNERNKPESFVLHRAVEIDPIACETLRLRHGAEKVIEGDITKLHIAKRILDESKHNVDIVMGGIPCQSFSLIGPRSGFGKKIEKFKNDARDSLYEHFRDVVSEIKPKVIVIENVKGILSKRDNAGKLIIEKILADFEAEGYRFDNDRDGKKYMVLNSANYGVPQRRERVILLGVLRSHKDQPVPFVQPTHFCPITADEEDIKPGMRPHVTLWEAIGDLPKVNVIITKTGLDEKDAETIARRNAHVFCGADVQEMDRERFAAHKEAISEGGREFLRTVRHGNMRQVFHHETRPQQLSDMKLFAEMNEGETAGNFAERCPALAKQFIKYDLKTFKDKYRKQKANEPSTTIFAHLSKDGNRFIHPKQDRTLTPREAARLQSFPDDFMFHGSVNQKFKQIGNAVPPLMARAIANSVTQLLS